MQLFSDFFDIIILMGALQGFLISILLYNSRNKANSLLSLLIFFIALASLNTWFENQIWYQSNTFFLVFDAVVPMVIIMPVGPLLYFYIQSSLHPDFTIPSNYRSHFYTVIIDLLPALVAIAYIIGAFGGLFKGPGMLSTFLDNYNVYSDVPRWLSLTIYLIYSFRYINGYLNQKGKATQHQVKWLRQCVMAFAIFQIIWFIYLVPYVIPAFTDKILNNLNWYPIYIPLSILIYWLGIKGYLLRHREQKKDTGAAELPPTTIDKTVLSLKQAMEESKLYLDPELNLNSLSQQTGIAPKVISAVLNQHLQVSFNDFVNEYRVAAFKEEYSKPENKHYTIIGIAFECGFSSQATFQRAFKQFTGLSPSGFKKL